MTSDTIKNVTSSLAAIFIVVFGMWQIGQLIQAGQVSGDAGLGLLAILIGGAATWLFNRESQTQAARQVQSAFTSGAQAAVPPNPPPFTHEQMEARKGNV